MADIHTKLLTKILQRIPKSANCYSNLIEDEKFLEFNNTPTHGNALQAPGCPQEGEDVLLEDSINLGPSKVEKNACVKAAAAQQEGKKGFNCKDGLFKTNAEKTEESSKKARKGNLYILYIFLFLIIYFSLNPIYYYFLSLNQNAFQINISKIIS